MIQIVISIFYEQGYLMGKIYFCRQIVKNKYAKNK